jgi:hypothetical protein
VGIIPYLSISFAELGLIRNNPQLYPEELSYDSVLKTNLTGTTHFLSTIPYLLLTKRKKYNIYSNEVASINFGGHSRKSDKSSGRIT